MQVTSRIANTFILASLLALPGSGFAQDLDIEKIRGETDESPVSVLQNRAFVKAMRPEIGFIVGTVLNEAYTKTIAYGGRIGFFFTDWLGLDIQYLTTDVSATDDRKALDSLEFCSVDKPAECPDVIISPEPEVNPINTVIDLNLVWAPLYGKMNLLDYKILYTDVYLVGGASSVDTDQGSHVAITIGAGQRFYFNDSLSVRVDFRDRIYNEKRNGKDTIKHALAIDIGASVFFF